VALSRSARAAINRLFAVGVTLLAFGSIYRPEALGFLAASPGVLFLLVAALLSINGHREHPVALRTWLTLGSGFASSCLAFLVFGWNPVFAAKIAPLFLLSLAWFSPLLCLPAIRLRAVRAGLVGGLIVLAVGYLFGDVYPDILSTSVRQLIFGGGYEFYNSDRPRGFMTETSHFALLVGRFGILLILLLEVGRGINLRRFVARVLLLLPFLLLTKSKGMAIALAGTLVMFVISRRTAMYAVFLIPLVWKIAQWQAQLITIDIENFTSTSTRLTLLLAGSASIANNPFGWGYYGFYGAIETYAAWAMDTLSGFPLLFAEIEFMLDERANYSFKSTMLDFGVLYGLPFVLLLWSISKRIDRTDPRIRFTWIFFLFTTMSTAGHESISFFLGLSIMLLFSGTKAQHQPI